MEFKDYINIYETHLYQQRIKDLKDLSLVIACGDYKEVEMAVFLKKVLPFISYFCDEEDKSLLEFCGLTELTFKYFISFESLTKELYPILNDSDYIINFEEIFVLYENYMSDLLFSIINLESGIDIDLYSSYNKITRSIKAKRFHNGLSSEIITELNENSKLINENLSELGYIFKHNAIAPNMKRFTKFPHKVWINILYKNILSRNEDRNVSDFKVFFYDIMVILIRDKSVTKEKSNETFKSERRRKIKRVERILLS